MSSTDFLDFKEDLLKNEKIRKAYDELQPKYDLIRRCRMTQAEMTKLEKSITGIETAVSYIGQDITEIKKQFTDLNGSVKETMVKLAKTTEVAKNAQESASDCRKYIDKITIAVIGSIITAIASIVCAVIK